MKIKSEINRKQNKIQGKIDIKSCFLEKINKIDKLLVGVTKLKKRKDKIITVNNEKGCIITGMKMLIRKYQKQLYAHTFNNVDKVDQFLDGCKILKLTEVGSLKRPMTVREIVFVL